MKKVIIILISFFFLECGSYVLLEDYRTIALYDKDEDSTLIFSNHKGLDANWDNLDSLKSVSSNQINIGDSVSKLNDAPIKADTIFQQKQNDTTFTVYRWHFKNSEESYRLNNQVIDKVDVFLYHKVVIFIKYSWLYL